MPLRSPKLPPDLDLHDLVVAIGNRLMQVPPEGRATAISLVRGSIETTFACVEVSDWPPGLRDDAESMRLFERSYAPFFRKSDKP